MENKIKSFEDLKIWQEGIKITVEIYSLFRACKDFGLRDQIQRSAVSVPSNIAEGFDRQSNNEFIRFLKISKGSLAELRTQLIIATRVSVINEQDELIKQTTTFSAMIQKMITNRESIKSKK